MAIKLMNEVWRLDYLNCREKILLLALADHANNEGTCYPSVKGLRKKCSCSTNTLNKNLKILKGSGLITVVARASTTEGRKTNLYRINHSCFHTGSMSEKIKASREKYKLKKSSVENNAQHNVYQGARIHPGSDKPLGQRHEVDITKLAQEVAKELEKETLPSTEGVIPLMKAILK